MLTIRDSVGGNRETTSNVGSNPNGARLTLGVQLNGIQVSNKLARAVGRRMDRLVDYVRDNTPVDTGFLRSNWFWSARNVHRVVRGVRIRGLIDHTTWRPDFGGVGSFRHAGATVYLINNVDYGRSLEYGTEGATQVHRGFFSRAVITHLRSTNR